jgi:hypothetical protein
MSKAELEAALAERDEALEAARNVIDKALGWDDDADEDEDESDEDEDPE